MNDALRPTVIILCRVMAVLSVISAIVCVVCGILYSRDTLIYSAISSICSGILALGLADAESYIEGIRKPKPAEPVEAPIPVPVARMDKDHRYATLTRVAIRSIGKNGQIVDLTPDKTYTLLLDNGSLITAKEEDLEPLA